LQIKELNLDNCRATQIAGLTDAFVNLSSLSLINVGLTTLKGFPNLPALKKVCMGVTGFSVITRLDVEFSSELSEKVFNMHSVFWIQ
jgi:hypothetical protein